MGVGWKEGDEVEGALYIGRISDAEKKHVAAIAVTSFKVIGSIKVDGIRQWLLDPLELCVVDVSGEESVFTVIWSEKDSDGSKESRQSAFTTMVSEFGPGANLESYGCLVNDFYENHLIRANEDMIDEYFDMLMSWRDQGNEQSATESMQYEREFISNTPRREKGIWQFVATDASKKDEDERLDQMMRIAKMGQKMLDEREKDGPKKKFSQLN